MRDLLCPVEQSNDARQQGIRVRAAENKDNGLGYHALTRLSLSIEHSVE